ncbi:MAG TPA: nuclear transport factor 2 family protein [Holophagaceae bacterium]|nr:nuclear transport factor 2 family protein [Holophagaceae bacterium]
MHPHAELLTRFYEAFQRRDAEAMGACYHDDAVFMDPAFGRLKAAEARAMWAMFAARATELEVTFEVKDADDGSGAVHWEAKYPFSGTGRRVHNVIEAQFGFHEGKILAHRDQFDLWAWSRQALGLPGILLGWSPFMKRKIQARARMQLAKWMAKEPTA